MEVFNVICWTDDFYYLFMHFCPGTMTTHAESIYSDLQRGLTRRLQHTQQFFALLSVRKPVTFMKIIGEIRVFVK